MIFETNTATVYVRVNPTTVNELNAVTDFVNMVAKFDCEEWEIFKAYSADKLKHDWALYYKSEYPLTDAEIEYSYDDDSVTIEQIWSY